MTKITVKIEGVGATVKSIGLFDLKMRKEFIGLVRVTAKGLSKDAKSKAPVSSRPKMRGKSGDLKRSIRPKYFDNGLSATVVPRKPKGSHRHLVEYGTQRRFTKNGANRGKMPAIPFMGPAEKTMETSYNQKVRKIINRDQTI